MKLTDELHTLLERVRTSLAQGQDSEALRASVLSRKGELSELLGKLKDLPANERSQAGQAANSVKVQLEELLSRPVTAPAVQAQADSSVPPFPSPLGGIHPISAMTERMVRIFQDLSFEVVEGPELVSDHDNFEVLNLSLDHPARDTQDSLYLEDHGYLMRTQTSSMQVNEMRKRLKSGQMPIRVVVPGRVYRNEATDATHLAAFNQLEGIMVDTQTTFADLKGTLDFYVHRLFGSKVETRFRPHHFPYTEPSAEMDIRWKGTEDQKDGGWLECLGCGMIHPKVLERAGINPKIYQGWAFGMGIERPIKLMYQVPDLRLFSSNAISTLKQFGGHS